MTDPKRPLVSIVTPCFNQADFIEEMIQSVTSQDYQPIEHIVIDGGSTDGTLEILKKYQEHLYWISEPDQGQAAAINKGFRRAHGTILCWLNGDDLLMPGAISTIVDYFLAHPDIAFVYGDALGINQNGHPFGRRTHIAPCDFDKLVRIGDFIVQPAAFWRSELWQTVGELDEQWHYVLDYEYWIRASQHYELAYIPVCLAKERMYSSAKTFRGGIERVIELEEMPRRFGAEGVPQLFRPEAASVYLVRAWTNFKQRNWEAARADMRKGLQLNNASFKTTLFVASTILFGESSIAGLRLMSNRLRGLFQRG